MNNALDLPPRRGEPVVVRISPSFEPDRTLSLVAVADGSFVLRSTQMNESAWGTMMNELHREQGANIKLDDEAMAAALGLASAAKTVRERPLDAASAQLLMQLWGALARRVQIVKEVGGTSVEFDGTRYRNWSQGVSFSTHSPSAGSILGVAMASVESLDRFVQGGDSDDSVALIEARRQMGEALARTLRDEPCLREPDTRHE